MQRKAIVARWFELVAYRRRPVENPDHDTSYSQETIGFSSTENLARRKAQQDERLKDAREIRWYHLDLRNAPELFFVIYKRSVVLDRAKKTSGRVVSDREVSLPREEWNYRRGKRGSRKKGLRISDEAKATIREIQKKRPFSGGTSFVG